jgi:hypothetical protein
MPETSGKYEPFSLVLSMSQNGSDVFPIFATFIWRDADNK